MPRRLHNYNLWRLACYGQAATTEALLQNLEEGKSNKHVEFINTLCVAIEKELTPPPRPAPHIGEEQDKER